MTAGDDPWDAHTVEWTTTSPAPADNYPSSCRREPRRPQPVFDMTLRRHAAVSHDEPRSHLLRLPACRGRSGAAPPDARRHRAGVRRRLDADRRHARDLGADPRRVVDAGERFPVDYIITEVASNVMLMTIFALCLFAQWAVYAGKRGDRAHAALALGVVALMAIAFINAQAFVSHTMEMPVAEERLLRRLFYAMTGTMTGAGRSSVWSSPPSPRSARSAAARRHRDPRRPRPVLVLRRRRLLRRCGSSSTSRSELSRCSPPAPNS